MIVGFAGFARSGKHEAAKALETYGFETHAYADVLRNVLYTLNPIVASTPKGVSVHLQSVINEHGWDGYKKTEHNDEIRRLIQRLGTDCGRNIIGKNVWVDKTLMPYRLSSAFLQWSIADVRFANEAQAIKDLDGIVLWISKPGVGPVNEHESEQWLGTEYIDAVIRNDGSVSDLHSYVRGVVAAHFRLR